MAAPSANANRDNREYRQALREYYRENGLGQPQRIVAELQTSRILRAVYSERQLNEVMVDFWSNHFNVFFGKGADRWLLTSYDRDTIRPNAMGKFSELLVATAQSPAMLFYLDNFQSVSPNSGMNELQRRRRGFFGQRNNRRIEPDGAMTRDPAARPPQAQRMRRGINENYARELMELHTLRCRRRLYAERRSGSSAMFYGLDHLCAAWWWRWQRQPSWVKLHEQTRASSSSMPAPTMTARKSS